MSQVDLAKLLDVSSSLIGNWEADLHVPTNRSLGKIAAKLGTTVEYLTQPSIMRGEQSPEPANEPTPGYGARKPIPDWLVDLAARLEVFEPEARRRVISACHLIVDTFSSRPEHAYAPASSPPSPGKPRPMSSAGMEDHALRGAEVAKRESPPPPVSSGARVETSEQRVLRHADAIVKKHVDRIVGNRPKAHTPPGKPTAAPRGF